MLWGRNKAIWGNSTWRSAALANRTDGMQNWYRVSVGKVGTRLFGKDEGQKKEKETRKVEKLENYL